MLQTLVDTLPHVNAGLNAIACILLVFGYVVIKRGYETAHKQIMLTCFGVSVVFLISYLTYHQVLYAVTGQRGKAFEYEGAAIRYLSFSILISHVVLAVAVPILAVMTIYFGLKDKREQHRKIARWTFPIWLYVSVTGVLVYLMLYWLFVPPQ